MTEANRRSSVLFLGVETFQRNVSDPWKVTNAQMEKILDGSYPYYYPPDKTRK